MRTKTIIGIATAIALATTSASAFAQGRQGGGSGRDMDRAGAPERAQVERGQRDMDRDRMRDRDRTSEPERDRTHDRDQDRTKAPETAPHYGDGIYGNELMSVQERNQYREQLRLTESDPQARTEFLAQHREKMQLRAKEQGKKLADPPDED